jgi:hypothetical protein
MLMLDAMQEEHSPSTESEQEDEAVKAAIAARAARKQRTNSPKKPPLPKASPNGDGRQRRENGPIEDPKDSPPGKEKRKSLLSRNPRKMLGKIAARVRSRSRERSSREPSPAIDL